MFGHEMLMSTRMKPYEFYFLDPRLVSIDWQARETVARADLPTIDSIPSQKGRKSMGCVTAAAQNGFS
jgi:hypothetical protein